MTDATVKTNIQTKSSAVNEVFLQQAKSLVKGGECLPTVEALAARLEKAARESRPLKVKLGLDPTRPDLHLGHSVVLKILRAFQDLGHQAILIIGDATALIGDPSGKNETRPPLTEAEVQANAQTYLEQAGKVLDIEKAQIVQNSQWFSGMALNDFLKLSAKATVAQILERDDFSKRYADGRPIYMHELFYPLMQGYDSVMIEADIELGGSDQRFNNLMGRELQNAYGHQDAEGQPLQQLVILAPILEGTDGVVKMSKSYPEHCINLTDPPSDFFGKMMSIPDALIPRYQLLLTPMSEAQVQEQVTLMDQGHLNPRDVKAHLAKWLVSQYFSHEVAEEAEQAFINQFRNKQLPDDMPEVSLSGNGPHLIVELMVAQGLAASKTEARRLIDGGGVKIHRPDPATGEDPSPEKVSTVESVLGDLPCILQVGKRRFVRFKAG